MTLGILTLYFVTANGEDAIFIYERLLMLGQPD